MRTAAVDIQAIIIPCDRPRDEDFEPVALQSGSRLMGATRRSSRAASGVALSVISCTTGALAVRRSTTNRQQIVWTGTVCSRAVVVVVRPLFFNRLRFLSNCRGICPAVQWVPIACCLAAGTTATDADRSLCAAGRPDAHICPHQAPASAKARPVSIGRPSRFWSEDEANSNPRLFAT